MKKHHLSYIQDGIAIFMIFVFLAAVIMQNSKYTAAGNKTEQFFDDGKGNFYSYSSDDSNTRIGQMKSDTAVQIFFQSISSDSALYSGGNLVIVNNKDNRLTLLTASKNAVLYLVSLNNIILKKNCIAADKTHTYYITDKRNPSEIISCSANTVTSEKYQLPSAAQFLFSDEEGENVFAVCENGVYDILKGVFITCTLPEGDIRMNGSYCTDSNGNVYTFSPTEGFALSGHYSYTNLCVTDEGKVFAAEDHHIYLLDETGSPVSCYTAESDIIRLMASGSQIAAFADSFFMPKMSDFQRIPIVQDESSSDTQESETSLNISHPTVSEQSHGETVHQEWDGNADSDIYEIENGIIRCIPLNTTVTVFKSNLKCGDAEISIINHNQKIVTSGKIGTGWRVEITSGQKKLVFYTAVTGDVTGEGNINSRDVKTLGSYMLHDADLTEYQKAAADMDGNGIVELRDLYKIYCSY